jgi:hypothetical protein
MEIANRVPEAGGVTLVARAVLLPGAMPAVGTFHAE